MWILTVVLVIGMGGVGAVPGYGATTMSTSPIPFGSKEDCDLAGHNFEFAVKENRHSLSTYSEHYCYKGAFAESYVSIKPVQ